MCVQKIFPYIYLHFYWNKIPLTFSANPLGGVRENTHTLESYADCLMTSGAIQNGVPTKVFLLLVVFVSCPATPKSANLTSPISLNKTLAAEKK
jgi:hypothetical protein